MPSTYTRAPLPLLRLSRPPAGESRRDCVHETRKAASEARRIRGRAYQALRALGDHDTPLEEAMGDTVRWCRTKRRAGGIHPAAQR